MTIKQLIARAGLALLLSCLWLAGAGAEEQGKADVVLRNGKIYTADPARSIKQAIAFSGNTILVVGDDSGRPTRPSSPRSRPTSSLGRRRRFARRPWRSRRNGRGTTPPPPW